MEKDMKDLGSPGFSIVVGTYPELAQYSKTDAARSISVIYAFNRAVTRYQGDIQAKRPTGNVDYHHNLIESAFAELPSDPALDRFKTEERKLLEEHKKTQKKQFGDLRRNSAGVYVR